MNIDKIMAYDWSEMIARILKGLKNFIDMVEWYFPTTTYKFEDPKNYKDEADL